MNTQALRAAILLMFCATSRLPAEAPAGLRVAFEPEGFVTLAPERPPVGEMFLVERSADLKKWEPAMPARLCRADDPPITLPVSGNKHHYRLVLNPAPDAAMIPVAYNSLGTAFLLGKFEVTVGEWNAVVASAAAFGYDLFPDNGSPHPDMPKAASWYDALKWCNLRSEIEGLPVAYTVNGLPYRTGLAVPQYSNFRGYRLPTNSEWDFAVRGGAARPGFIYSGSNDIDEVAWYADNSQGGPAPDISGRGPRPVGWKMANTLGCHDMNGNVWEWVWDVWPYSEGKRYMRGGAYGTAKIVCTCGANGGAPPETYEISIGFRIARTP